MILYNVTVGIDLDVEEEWINWMISTHIPEVMDTGIFKKYDMYRIIGNEDQGASYSIQYMADSISDVQRYLGQFAPDLMKKHMDRYKDKHVAFRTILEKVG